MKTDIIVENLKSGDKLYSTIHGIVVLKEILNSEYYPIETIDKNGDLRTFNLEGKYINSLLNPVLFKKNPFKEKERVVLVRQFNGLYYPRVLLSIKNGMAICWNGATTIKEAKNIMETTSWNDWKEIEETLEIVELTFQDISNGKGVEVDPKLIKIIL